MKYEIRKKLKRVLSMLLTVLVIFATMPLGILQVSAETGEATGNFSFTVTDGESPIEGAEIVVTYSVDESNQELSATTGEDGTVVFADISALKDSGLTELEIAYTVTAEGYEEVGGSETITDFEGNIDVTLTESGILPETVTVTVSVTGEATVKLNDAEQDSVTVDKDTSVKVEVTPGEGNYIASLTIDGVKEEITDENKTLFTKEIVATKNIVIDAIIESETPIVAEYQVTVAEHEHGTVTLNGETVDSLTVEENASVTVEVEAEGGYYISAVKIGETEQDITGITNYGSFPTTITEDTEITVTFVKVYNVTVAAYEHGAVTLNGETVDSLTVEENASVTVKVEAEDGYYISAVKIGETEQDITGITNYGSFPTTITEDTEITVTFVKVYNVTVAAYEHGAVTLNGETVDSLTVEENASVTVKVEAEDGYYISSVKIGEIEQDITGITNYGSFPTTITEDTEITVTFVNVYNVTVAAYEHGTVTLNGETVDSLTVEENASVTVKVEAEDGYYISSVKIGEIEQDITGITNYGTFPATITEDTEITVTFVKVYVISVTHDENGTVSVTHDVNGTDTAIQETEEGKVTVESQDEVKITATPGTGYYVSKVVIDDVELDVDETNESTDGKYQRTLTVEKDYTIEIMFSRCTYQVTAAESENGSVNIEVPAVEYEGDTGIYVIPNDGYTIDEIFVKTGVNSEAVAEFAVVETGIYFELKNITADKNVIVTFKEIAKAVSEYVEVDSRDAAIQNDEETIFVLREATDEEKNNSTEPAIIFSTVKDGLRLYDDAGNLLGGDEETSSISICETKKIARVELYYQADGELYATWHDVELWETIEVIVDAKVTATLTPDRTGDGEEKYYKEDVPFTVLVKDEGTYAGIERIEYKITTVTNENVETTILYEYVETEDKWLTTYQKDADIVVDAERYNESGVKVTLIVTDRVGNVEEVEYEFNINSTQPTVSAVITGDVVNEDLLGYYYKSRKAVVTITDREDTFSQEAVKQGIVVKKNGKVVEGDDIDEYITWDENDQYKCVLNFSDDAVYEWDIAYKNKAGMTNGDVNIVVNSGDSDPKNPFAFTVDNGKPEDLKITYSQGFSSTETRVYYNDKVLVTLSAKDAVAGIDQFVYSYTGSEEIVVNSDAITYDENTASVSFEIPATTAYEGSVQFRVMDKAGWSEDLSDATVLVVDTEKPVITVEYDNNDVENGNYYAANRTATITIKETNFFETDLTEFKPGTEEEYLVIMVGKTSLDGTTTETKERPTFAWSDEVQGYVATVAFEGDGEYTFDIKYTDRAGNVYDDYETDYFIIDTEAPELSISLGSGAYYYTSDPKATIKIAEQNFRAEDVQFNVSVTDFSGQVIDVSAEGYAPKNWDLKDGYWTTELVFKVEGNYEISMEYADLAGNPQESVATISFCLDKTVPTDLKATYFETVSPMGLVDKNQSTERNFDFYNKTVTVILEATDAESGIEQFVYSYTGSEEITVGRDAITYEGNKASISFQIDPQYRGKISFTAMDKTERRASWNEEKTLVVDSEPPVITVEYDNNEVENEMYYKADRTATITIKEANFFEEDLVDYNAETEEEYLVIAVGRKLSDETIFTVTKEKPKFEWSEEAQGYVTTIAFQENGEYTFDIKYTDRAGNVNDSYVADYFVIDKVAPKISASIANGAFYGNNREVEISIEEKNFSASDVHFTVTATDITGNAVDVSTCGHAAFLQNQENWVQSGEVWTTKLCFDVEGNYEIGMNYTDLAGNAQKSVLSDFFCVDKSKPENVNITYSDSLLDKILGKLFKFYKANVTVTVEATDEYAGIEAFVYSYVVEEGADTVNVGAENVMITAESGKNFVTAGNGATATFTIPAQFRGCVTVTAIDYAGNSQTFGDERVVVVDDKAPEITVTYDNNDAVYGNYYAANRTATITIKEANFFEEDLTDFIPGTEEEYLVITVGKTLNDGVTTVTKVRPKFIWSDEAEGYVATVLFDEDADYTFDIKYTDRSGNVYDAYEEDKFTVDKTMPLIKVSYDVEAPYKDNTCLNGDQFRADRMAVIEITEHNFNAIDVVAVITANGTKADYYTEYMAADTSWTHNGDVHTAVIRITEEAHYTFDIEYVDMAGNKNAGVDFGTSLAPQKFTLDKTAPTDLTITIGDESILGTNDISFHTFYGDGVAVKLSANCDISGLQSLKYQKVPAVSLYNENGIWADYDVNTGIMVSPSEKFIIYVRAEDRAGNVSIVNSVGIVVDNQAPIIELFPDGSNEHGLYNSNVNVGVSVGDPQYIGDSSTDGGYFSGLSEVTYTITADGISYMESGVLFDATSMSGDAADSDGLIYTWSGSVSIDASSFNSNSVTVEVTATDNAGNVITSTTNTLMIDVTAPTIDVAYDNNTTDAENVTFFNAPRVATITVTERNFRPEDAIITITNTDGVIPTLSGWNQNTGSGNQDDTTWTATIFYEADGDYTFDIEFKDSAGNVCEEIRYGESVAPTEFTVDTSKPVVNVEYADTGISPDGYYYPAIRTATITIVEHNLEPNGADKGRVEVTVTKDEEQISNPIVSWNTQGDSHTATITYDANARYTFHIAVKDKAGQVSDEFVTHRFCVDTIAPMLTFSGVENGRPTNADVVVPVITYSDINMDFESVDIQLIGASNGEFEDENSMGIYADYTDDKGGRGQTFTFNNFAVDKKWDDIYAIQVSLKDKAGNITTKNISFSINRFGSTYDFLDGAVQAVNGKYVKGTEIQDLIIEEVNVNKLSEIKVIVFKNNEAIELKERVDENGEGDYKITIAGDEESGYTYTYTIFKETFADDAVYRVTVWSKDAAGNISENTLDSKNMEISFGVDNNAPEITVKIADGDLKSDEVYSYENLPVYITIRDGLRLSAVELYLDDYENAYRTWTNENIAELINANGEIEDFSIPGNSTESHSVKLVCVDAAGNESVVEFVDIYVTTDWWVRFSNNKPLLYGSVAGVVGLSGLSVTGVVWRRRRRLRIDKR